MTQPYRAASDAAAHLGAFDAAAADAVRLSPLLWDPVATATLARIQPTTGERVLDACCGTGPSALPTARAVGPHGAVDAVDLSAASIAELQRARRQEGDLIQLEAHAADVTTWPGRGYDVVQCLLGVFFFPDPVTGTEHLVRCARPDGRVAVTTWTAGALRSAGEALVQVVRGVSGRGVAAPAPSAVARALGQEDSLRRWLSERGLEGVEVTRHAHTVPAEAEALWLLVVGSGFRGLLSGLSRPQVDRVREQYLEVLVDGPNVDASFLVATGHRPEEVPTAHAPGRRAHPRG